ncbi:MAG TPA: hypothetical protein VGG25_21440 [Streptosporangiaceae bacterium]
MAVALGLMAAMGAGGTPASSAAAAPPPPSYRHVCAATAPPGYSECLALLRGRGPAAGFGRATPALMSAGYQPRDLRAAYHLAAAAAAAGTGQTVAVVDAYDDPDAAANLTRYRARFGLPPCTTAARCFTKVNQDGAASPLPQAAGSTGWATEESLDLDMVSAICPHCHLILVEASDEQNADLGRAVDSAVRLGARFVSNSYGGLEYPGETAEDGAYYDHPGVVVTASAGDTRPSSPSRPGSGMPGAPTGPWPTSRPTPTRAPASWSTTPMTRAAGGSSAARRWPPRSSPRPTRWLAGRAPSTTPRDTPTPTPAGSTT